MVVDPASRRRLLSQQFAAPFGAVASVYAWDRVGHLVARVARVLLSLPILRYVDDFFGVERAAAAASARRAFVLLCQACVVPLALDKTPAPAPCAVILGVAIDLAALQESGHVSLAPDVVKLAVWKHSLDTVIGTGTVSRSTLERLTGQLGFACFAIWGARARGALQPLHAAIAACPCMRSLVRVQGPLAAALRERRQRLEAWGPRRISLQVPDEVLTIYSDAEGLGAWGIVLLGHPAVWARGSFPAAAVAALRPRINNIAGFELLAAIAALLLAVRRSGPTRMHVFVDNAVALSALVRGTAAPDDLRSLSACLHEWSAQRGLALSFSYVPSSLNLADAPSRGRAPPYGQRIEGRVNWSLPLSWLAL